MRRAAKRDDVEREIITTWEAMGAYVEAVSGPGIVDTLVHHKGRLFRAEVKGAKRGLTPKQVDNFKKAYAAGVPTFIVRTVDEAKDLLECPSGTLLYVAMLWKPEHGALAGASRKERAFRPGTDKARTLAECCKEMYCPTSAVPGTNPPRCAGHVAQDTFAPDPASALRCERDGCTHPWIDHTHSSSPVPKAAPEKCNIRGCKCTGYVGMGPASLRRRVP
jgi:hypothetical protein